MGAGWKNISLFPVKIFGYPRSVSGLAAEYGRLFYLINPATSSFSRLADCPDYVQHAMPYMTSLIVMEAAANLWLGKRHNLADR